MEHRMLFQLHFMDLVKERLPQHLNMPQTVAGLLNVRINSAYRRIRAEQILSVKELDLLATHFDIDLEAVKNMDEASMVFYGG